MKNILVLTYWSYQDALIQTYTLPYVRIIKKYLPENSKIFFVTFEQPHLRFSAQQKNHEKEILLKEKIHWLDFNYSQFGFLAIIKNFISFLSLLLICRRNKITVIHCWCTPAGTMGYLLSKLTGIPLIIDSYEPHAEAMVENGTWGKNSFTFKLLFFFEKLQTKKANVVIATTAGMKDYAKTKYNIIPKRFYVKPACVNLEIFSYANKKKNQLVKKLGFENKIICVYAGKFGGIYLIKEVFDFFKTAHEYWKDKFRVLLLTSHSPKEIKEYCKISNQDYSIVTQLFVPHNEIPDYIGLADFAITPVKPVPTKKYCSPIKDGEYWALGLPVVITPGISDDSNLISHNTIGSILEAFNEDSYLSAVKKIDNMLLNFSTEELYRKIRPLAEKYRNFIIAEKIYKEIYNDQI